MRISRCCPEATWPGMAVTDRSPSRDLAADLYPEGGCSQERCRWMRATTSKASIFSAKVPGTLPAIPEPESRGFPFRRGMNSARSASCGFIRLLLQRNMPEACGLDQRPLMNMGSPWDWKGDRRC